MSTQPSDDRLGFPPGVAEHLGYYVYLLIHPRTGRPFYVGKGTGSRCFAHIAEARKTQADTKGDYPKLAAIRAIEATGAQVRIEVLRHRLTETEAFAVEASAIDLLGLTELHNRVTGSGATMVGRMSIGDLTARYAATPIEIPDDEAIMLIRVSRAYQQGMTAEDLYRVTRCCWKINPRRARNATQVLAVYNGVVRAVYTDIDWHSPTPAEIAEDPTREGRWAFTGRPDPEGEARYLYTNTTEHLAPGAQNPIRYINC